MREFSANPKNVRTDVFCLQNTMHVILQLTKIADELYFHFHFLSLYFITHLQLIEA